MTGPLTTTVTAALSRWTLLLPPLAAVLLLLVWGRDLPAAAAALTGLVLVGAVLAAVHHAEVVAHRVGEPLGSLLLAVAVTVIEVALILTLMVDAPDKNSTLARDTVFAAIMITCNGIVGLCLLLGALRTRVAVFNPEGTGAALATVATLATLSLALPSFTTSTPGPLFSPTQLTFASVAALVLYGLFVATQTVRHREYFLPPNLHDTPTDPDPHDERPTSRAAALSLVLLMIALIAVVGLAKAVSPTIERGVTAAGLPASVMGVVIAMLVLLPETIAAVRSARRDQVQIGLNLALGSAMASIGLTIPAVALASVWLSGPLVLGLGASHLVLLALTVAVGTLTVIPGRATPLQGGVHLSVLAAYVVLAVSP
ncbi:ionic transporter y4hA [Kitasatospora sp. NBC_01287]|uniref:calcium:proton antiporter n=1 Tax=Kitasatospora sp. NBC_01287 TaxID=2903573 RepID=UPI00224DA389|nr:ionic transporter y4hA [Kitasatospora sp. NBC_01287]MCX4744537.1 ionic transporter y4hA [Kitasatospora sp. NBC_01287]